MDHTIMEILNTIKEHDVKFVRLSFCDLLGQQKNISIMASELEYAFSHGISFDGSSITGFSDLIHSDLLLFPDPKTLCVLPWRPQQGRVFRFYCDIKNTDKTPFICDCRMLLKQVLKRGKALGYTCKIGTESEFYLFKTDENGEPLRIPHDRGGYFDVLPLDKGENIRREICLCLEEMEIEPLTSHHEMGPGQHEIDFKHSDALSAADNFLAFKYAVKSIAARNGLYASFMPKPMQDQFGSGLHINLSLFKNKENIFKNNEEHSPEAEHFIAGVLARGEEITLFLNSVINSYDRLSKDKAPKFISWSHQNRSQYIRIPAADGERIRMELRAADAALNPYLAFALIISAGLDGIEQELPLPKPVNEDLYHYEGEETQDLAKIPESLKEALAIASRSQFVKKVLGEQIFDKAISLKEQEIQAYEEAEKKEIFYQKRYFETI